jgi:hypothetical protein
LFSCAPRAVEKPTLPNNKNISPPKAEQNFCRQGAGAARPLSFTPLLFESA